MIFEKTRIRDVVLVKPTIHTDSRGYFMEAWRSSSFADAGITDEFVQDNSSYSSRGTLRGLHYQINRAQGKFVRVVSGCVFDVAVDLRRSSPTFANWVGFELNDRNHHCLWIPPGFAHGFLVISEFARFEYKCTDYYSPEDERSLLWNDPNVQIRWPEIDGENPNLSVKDANAPMLADAELFE